MLEHLQDSFYRRFLTSVSWSIMFCWYALVSSGMVWGILFSSRSRGSRSLSHLLMASRSRTWGLPLGFQSKAPLFSLWLRWRHIPQEHDFSCYSKFLDPSLYSSFPHIIHSVEFHNCGMTQRQAHVALTYMGVLWEPQLQVTPCLETSSCDY